MNDQLKGKRVAILATHGFEEVELSEPRKALEQAGAEVHIVAPDEGTLKAWDRTDWSKEYDVDVPLDQADSNNYDCLMLPGGVLNPDKLRMSQKAVQFASDFLNEGKPVAAICHAPQTLIETGALNGRKMTSYPSVKTDLQNAGAEWVDEEVVVHGNLTTSRKPDDIPVFNKRMIEEFRQAVPSGMPPG